MFLQVVTVKMSVVSLQALSHDLLSEVGQTFFCLTEQVLRSYQLVRRDTKGVF